MKHKLPIVTLAAAVAAGLAVLTGALDLDAIRGRDAAAGDAGTPGTEPPESGNAVLLKAADAVERYASLQGRVRQQVQLFGHQLAGTGSYRQAWNGGQFRFRFDLRVATEPVATHYLEVSDGRFLWLRRHAKDRVLLQRVDLKEVQATGGATRGRSSSSDAASAQPVVSTGFGGIPRMLRRLERRYTFRVVERTEIGREGVPVAVLRGTWKPQALRETYLPDLSGRPTQTELARLPEAVPHEVEILIGEDRELPSFPYRIRCFRQTGSGTVAIMTVEFFELSRGDGLSEHVFRYDPGNEEVEDATEAFRDAWLRGD